MSRAGQDGLLILAVVVFAGLLVFLAGRGIRGPEAAAPGASPAARGDAPAAPDAPAEARVEPGAAAAPDGPPADAGAGTSRPPGSAPGPPPAATGNREQPGPDPARPGRGAAGEPEPLGELSISGRVLDEGGDPVAGMRITARRQGGAAPGDVELAARSEADGRYGFANLAEGEYQLSTSDTERFVSRVLLARAGADSVDIVLVDRKELRITGTVRGERDEPLAGVSVRVLGNPGGQTDGEGRYELAISSSSPARVLLVRFEAEGYLSEEKRIELSRATSRNLVLDAQLEPARDAFRLEGLVRSSRGEPLASQMVSLRSKQLRANHQVSTGPDGRFAIDGFVPGSDWRLVVTPNGRFADHREGPLELDRRSAPLDIVLEPLAGGTVTGRVVDPDGRPLPGFRLWLTSLRARGQSRAIVADDSARFRVEDVAEGPLHFATRAVPWLRVTGIELEERGRIDVELVLDWGDYELAGRVLGDGGEPVSGADVRLSWSEGRGGLNSTSFRRTVSDSEGSFRFAQLGRGEHRLEVRADGYATARRGFPVSRSAGAVEVRLAREP